MTDLELAFPPRVLVYYKGDDRAIEFHADEEDSIDKAVRFSQNWAVNKDSEGCKITWRPSDVNLIVVQTHEQRVNQYERQMSQARLEKIGPEREF